MADRSAGVTGLNHSITILGSGARTTTPTKENLANDGCRGVIIVIDVTAVVATPSVVPTIQGYDPVSGKYWTILAGAALTETGSPYQRILRVYPGLTAVGNLVATDILPPNWAVDLVHGDADSITYSVTAHLIR